MIDDKDFIGHIFPQNCGDDLRIIEKTDLKKGNFLFKCQFLKYPCEILALKENIIKGKVNNYMYPSIYNIGYLGIGKYNKKSFNYIYNVWKGLLDRCYNRKSNRYNSYGAKGITVCDEWHNFQNFAKWYENNNYEFHDYYSLQIDKDLLSLKNNLCDCKIYSPETCLLLPQDLNIFLKFKENIFDCICKKNNKYNVNIVFKRGEKSYFKTFDNLYEALLNKYIFFENIKNDYIEKYKNFIPNKIINILKEISFFDIKKDKKVICFVGASGSGKSTILNYIKDKWNLNIKELSARKFLIPNIPYYEQLNDELQIKIVFENATQILKALYENEVILFSRSNLDPLIYSKLMNKGNILNEQQEELIDYLNKKIIYIYLPANFELSKDVKINDKERGDNEKLRQDTDKEIKKYLLNKNIFSFEVDGDLNERKLKIDKILNILGLI